MDLQDLNDLREACRCLELIEQTDTSAAANSLRKDAMALIERVLNKYPIVKDPVGGNIDVTTKNKGQIIDRDHRP